MTALAKLPAKWREEAADHDRHKDPLPASILRECADELEAALSPAELGGVELQRWSVIADGTGGVEEFKNVSGRWVKYADVAALLSTPRAAEASTIIGLSALILESLSARASAGEGGVRRNPAFVGEWHARAVALGYDGVADMLHSVERGEPPLHIAEVMARAAATAPQPAQAGASGGGEYEVRKGRNGEWGIFARGYNLRLAVFARGSAVDRDKIAAKLTAPASPATEQGGVSVESVRRALASYHLQFTEHDEDGPQSLFDALTPPGDVDIGRGIKELGLLADYVAAELSTPQPAAAQGGCDHLHEARAHVSNAMDDLDDEHRAMPQLREAAYHLGMLAAAPQPQEASAQGEIVAIVGERGSVSWRSERILPVGAPLYSTPPAHGDGEGDYAAKWFAECRRVLEDVSTEMRATGRGDTRFRRLIESMPRRVTPLASGALTTGEREVIETLLGLAYAAWGLADNTEDSGDEGLTVERSDFAALEHHLDELAKLPDDQPGYTMGEAAKARWALRRVLDAALALPAQGEG